MVRMMKVLLVLALAAALALAACGGDDDGDSDDTAADEAAVENLLLDYAALVDEDACALWSEELLAREGGLKGCLSEIGDEIVTTIKVDEVEIDGDNADVLLTVFPEDKQLRYPAVREGDSADSYDGWRLAEFNGEEVTAEAPETTADETAEEIAPETEETEAVSPPQTPEERAAVYRACIEGLGAKMVKQDDFPEVRFSGGGSFVRAAFGSSEEDAKQGLATFRLGGSPFAERFGTVVLYTVGDALANDLEIGLTCVKELR